MRISRRHAIPVLCALLLVSLVPPPAQAAQPAADLAVRLQALFGQHSVLAADVMRSRIRGDDDFVQAANNALGRNTDAMTDLMVQLFGEDMVNAFSPMWAEHVVELVAYASALAARDDAAREHAHEELIEYEGELSDFLASASHGRLKPSDAHHALAMHVEHLTSQADAYAARDYPTADRVNREAYQHMYDLGLVLADALLPAADRPALREPVWRLRSQLGKLFAEHVVLVGDVTRAAVANTDDFDAAARMINANTRDLTSAMDSMFGTATARRFQRLWGSQVEQLVAYSGATAAGDEQRREAARSALKDYEGRMAAFLSRATGDRMSEAELAAAFAGHDDNLMRHADAYAARDYATAHDIAYRAYEHEFELARKLADAFGETVAQRLPTGGAQTGFGGLARDGS
jgi:phage baseplate assembly protein W